LQQCLAQSTGKCCPVHSMAFAIAIVSSTTIQSSCSLRTSSAKKLQIIVKDAG